MIGQEDGYKSPSVIAKSIKFVLFGPVGATYGICLSQLNLAPEIHSFMPNLAFIREGGVDIGVPQT